MNENEKNENTAPDTFESALLAAGFSIGAERVSDPAWLSIAREVQTCKTGIVYAFAADVTDATLAAFVAAGEKTGATVMVAASSTYGQVAANVSNKLKSRKVNFVKVPIKNGDDVNIGVKFTRKAA
jgi:hypothetical protein